MVRRRRWRCPCVECIRHPPCRFTRQCGPANDVHLSSHRRVCRSTHRRLFRWTHHTLKRPGGKRCLPIRRLWPCSWSRPLESSSFHLACGTGRTLPSHPLKQSGRPLLRFGFLLPPPRPLRSPCSPFWRSRRRRRGGVGGRGDTGPRKVGKGVWGQWGPSPVRRALPSRSGVRHGIRRP